MSDMEGTVQLRGTATQLKLGADGLTLLNKSIGTKLIAAAEIVSCWMCPEGDRSCCRLPVSSPCGTEETGDITSSVKTFTSSSTAFLDGNLSSSSEDFSATGRHAQSSEQNSSNCDDLSYFHPSMNYETFCEQRTHNLCSLKLENCCKHSRNQGTASFCVEYCERARQGLLTRCKSSGSARVLGDWTTRVLVFTHHSPKVAQAWHCALWKTIKGLKERPRRLAVIINPFGGEKKAPKIYSSKVAPLFYRAGIATTVQQTTLSLQADELARAAAANPDVEGVVVVGGDGTLLQAVSGLLLHAAQEHNIDITDPKSELRQTTVRIAIIPGGTTNATVTSVHGSEDPSTAALHVIMGDRRSIDVASVHGEDGQVMFPLNCVMMGFAATINVLLGRLRWWPVPLRFMLSGILGLNKKRPYPCTMRLLTPDSPSATPYDEQICTASCNNCSSQDKRGDSTWVQVEGRYINVYSFLMSCRGKLSVHGASPAAHIGDGCCDTIITPDISTLQMLRGLQRVSKDRHHLHNNEHVTVMRCTEFEMSSPQQVPWAVDGEVYYGSHYRIRIHRQKVQIFGRGIELDTT